MNSVDVPEQAAPVGRGVHRVRQLLAFARPYRRYALGGVGAMLVATAAELAAPLLAKFAIDDAITTGDRGRLLLIVIAFLVTAVTGFVARAAETWLIGVTAERTLADLRAHVFAHAQDLELGYYERTRTGVLISRMTNDIEALQNLISDGLTSTVSSVLTLIGSAVILVVLDWRLALATITVFPAMAVATALFRRFSARAYRRMREALAQVTASLQEDITGMRVIQAFRREPVSRARFLEVNGRYRAANQATVYSNALYFPVVELLAGIGTAIVFGYGGYRYISGSVAIGTLVAFAGYVSNFFDPVQQLSQLYNTFLAATAALDKIATVLDERPALVERPGALDVPLTGALAFDHVDFSYREGRPVLRDFTLDVPAGSSVALVGHTGAGKSTIVKLLGRLYDPVVGAVRLDGHDLRDLSFRSLRSQIAMVPQDAFLFNGTIRENIAYGRPDATLLEVEAVARAVGAHDFIADLEAGYDTPVLERGARLSIGQRQLLAFARALLCDPRILILDEATSSVDLATEARIEQALATLLTGRTSVIVAHRLSTIRNADRIVVLENGAIVEQGSHAELIAGHGPYRALYGDWADVA